MDALVSERLSSNERIVDIFGHCGTATLAVVMDSGDLDGIFAGVDHHHHHHGDGNNHTDSAASSDDKEANIVDPFQAMLFATEAAHALAALHGFSDGVIVHGDFSLSQLLLGGTHLQLNDFNRAEIMLYDANSESYCPYINSDFSVSPWLVSVCVHV